MKLHCNGNVKYLFSLLYIIDIQSMVLFYPAISIVELQNTLYLNNLLLVYPCLYSSLQNQMRLSTVFKKFLCFSV